MSQPQPHPQETTFRSYTPLESARYAALRQNYHPSVYAAILTHHKSTGGQLNHVLDVGCGPGLATVILAENFAHATGIDASESMIATARSLGPRTSTGELVGFEVSSAEAMEGVADESVDLICAANAAHWFDMAAFWPRAARVLRPGGSVAVWTSGEIAAHRDTPNSEAVNEAFRRFKEEGLRGFFERGNLLVEGGYRDLGMPWDIEPAGVEGFERASLWRREWDADSEQFMMGSEVPFTVEVFERMWATSSPVTRWRKAHPGAEGTEGDIVRVLRREIEGLLAEVGVPEGEAVLRGTSAGVVVMVKKVGGESM